MQIAQFLRVLIAVLSLAAVFFPAVCQHEQHFNNHTIDSHSSHSRVYEWIRTGYIPYDHTIPLEHAGELLSLRDNQMLLKKEAHFENRTSVECCPSVLEMTEPRGGKNRDDQIVELYHDGNLTQRFYEVSCHKDILDKPCRFMDKKLHGESRCKQNYMFTYALVKEPPRHHHGHHHRSGDQYSHNGSWTMDYIQIRSGCSCVVIPPSLKKAKKRDKFKNRRRHKGGGYD